MFGLRSESRGRPGFALFVALTVLAPTALAQRHYTVTDLGSIDTSDGGYGSGEYHLDSSRGFSINNRGEATGESRRRQTTLRNGFRWTNGKMEAQTGATVGTIHAINEAGAVAGWEESNRLGAPLRAMRALVGGHDLGTFDDADVSSDSARSYATGINHLGHGTGASQIGRDGTGAYHAFLWRGEFDGIRPRLINLGTLPGGYSSAGSGINDHDEVTGTASNSSAERAFLYSDGVMRDLGTLGGLMSRGHAINNAGQVVGEAENAQRVSRAFIYENGVMRDLGTHAGTKSVAYGVNQLGQVVGEFETGEVDGSGHHEHRVVHSFLYDRGEMVDLTTLVPNLLEVRDINDNGQIVGTAQITLKVYDEAQQRTVDRKVIHAVILNPVDGPQLRNISTRASAGAGERSLIAGFIVNGSAPKRLIVRGVGPSLSGAVGASAIADPALELRSSSGTLIANNDDWESSQRSEIIDTGVAPRAQKESAIVAELAPGAYTARVVTKHGSSGTALVEVYELPGQWGGEFANISTRGFVGRGDDSMIAGIIVGPEGVPGATEVLVRALGPSLSDAGVQDVLANPMLALHDENGARIAENDDWSHGSTSPALPPSRDSESALQHRVGPGAYTAVVSGKDGGAGVALVEVYHLR